MSASSRAGRPPSSGPCPPERLSRFSGAAPAGCRSARGASRPAGSTTAFWNLRAEAFAALSIVWAPVGLTYAQPLPPSRRAGRATNDDPHQSAQHRPALAEDAVPARHARAPRTTCAAGAAEHHPRPPAAYSPELNAIEKVWQYLRDRFLSARLFPGNRAIVDACCAAWNNLIAETGRIRSLADFEWARQVNP